MKPDRKKILVVDDEDLCTYYLESAFTEMGYEVKTAGTGGKAIEVGTDFAPDILVTDWVLRDVYDGVDVARELSKRIPGLKIVFITGLGPTELSAHASDLPYLAILQKPLDLDEIAKSVEAVLQGDGSGRA